MGGRGAADSNTEKLRARYERRVCSTPAPQTPHPFIRLAIDHTPYLTGSTAPGTRCVAQLSAFEEYGRRSLEHVHYSTPLPRTQVHGRADHPLLRARHCRHAQLLGVAIRRVRPPTSSRRLVCSRQFCKTGLLFAPKLLLPNPGANRKSISQRCYLEEVAFVSVLTKETIHLPLGHLQGGTQPMFSGASRRQ